MIWRSTSHSSHLYFLVCRKFSLLRVFFKRIVICLTKVFKSKYERGKPTNAFWGLEASVLRCSCFLKNLEIGFLWKLSKFLSVSSKFWMWELDYKEGWVPKNWCFWTVVLEKTLESPLDCKEIQPVHPKENQSWVFIGRTDTETETPILWPADVKNWLIGKDSDAGKDWRQEEKGMTENKMGGWHHQLDGHEFEQALVVGDEQGSLGCCSPWWRRVGPDWATELIWHT